MLGADVPPFGNPMFTVGGRAAVRSATVTGSGHAAVGCNGSLFCMEL